MCKMDVTFFYPMSMSIPRASASPRPEMSVYRVSYVGEVF